MSHHRAQVCGDYSRVVIPVGHCMCVCDYICIVTYLWGYSYSMCDTSREMLGVCKCSHYFAFCFKVISLIHSLHHFTWHMQCPGHFSCKQTHHTHVQNLVFPKCWWLLSTIPPFFCCNACKNRLRVACMESGCLDKWMFRWISWS